MPTRSYMTWEDDSTTPVDLPVMDELSSRRPERSHPCLWAVTGPAVGLRFELGEPVCGGITLIGRSAKADIVVDDPCVSRVHASIEWMADGARLNDHGSTNGTWLGERRISAHPLKEGDRFRVGHCSFVFGYAGRVAELPAPRPAPRSCEKTTLETTTTGPLAHAS